MRPLHVALVNGPTEPLRAALWRACLDLGVRLTTVGIGPLGDPSEGLPGADVVPLRPRGPLVRRANLWWWYPRLRAELGRLRPDLVHVLTEPWGIPVIQALRGEAPVVAHGADNLYRHGSRIERAVRRRVLAHVLPRLSGFASWNADGVRLAHEHGLPATSPTVVASPGIPDTDLFRPASEDEAAAARERFGLPLDEVVVGFVGRLVPEKGVRDLLEALRVLGPDAPRAAVWGRGPLAAAVGRAFAELRGAHLGFLRYAEVPAAMGACDLIVVPSRSIPGWAEQFGRVAVEALFRERPVVAYASGSLPEVVEGAARLVPEGDIAGLAAAIGELSADRETRRAEGAAGRERMLARFGTEVVAERLVRFWQRVLA